jgi:hypothetical protein
MDALLALLLVSVGFALFIFIVNRSLKYIVLAALTVGVVAAVVLFGGTGI